MSINSIYEETGQRFRVIVDKIIECIFFVMLLVLLLYFLFPKDFFHWNPIFINVEKVFLGIFISLFLACLLLLKKMIQKTVFRFSIGDYLLMAYVLFLLIHKHLLRQAPLDFLTEIEALMLISLYFCIRNIPLKKVSYILKLIVFTSLIQIYFGISNQTWWFAPGYGLSNIKGSYINQGPFAGSVACSLIILLSFFKVKRENGYFKILILNLIPLFLLILFSSVLIISTSRAAWLSTIVGVRFYTWKMSKARPIAQKSIDFKKIKHSVIVILTTFIVFTGIYMLYAFKKDSANGRLLIWSVTKELIQDKPILGHGINSFKSKYMEYQANYFKKNNDSPYNMLASDNRYAFNEFLRLFSEQGMIGIAIVFLIVYFSFKAKSINGKLSKSSSFTSIKSILLALFIFGMFSYPWEVLQLKIIICISLAVLSGNTESIKKFKKFYQLINDGIFNGFPIIRYLGCTSLIFIFLLFCLEVQRHFSYYKEWNLALAKFTTSKNYIYLNFCQNAYPKLKNNGDFLALYGISLSKERHYIKSIEILQRAALFVPTSKIYLEMGKSYKELKEYDKAENCWSIASLMVPSLFRPGYLTAKMYKEIGQTAKSKKIATQLLDKEVKVYSIEVHQIRSELEKIISEPDTLKHEIGG